jgi:hypothetical protein
MRTSNATYYKWPQILLSMISNTRAIMYTAVSSSFNYLQKAAGSLTLGELSDVSSNL